MRSTNTVAACIKRRQVVAYLASQQYWTMPART